MTAIPLSPFDTDLLVFVDETGHEDMQVHRDPVFGFGGCAIRATDYERIIAAPWRALRKAHLGSEDRGLHATALRQLGLDDARLQSLVEAIGGFFRRGSFHRLVAIAKETARRDDWMHNYDQLMLALMNRVVDVARRHPDVERAVLVIEHSHRLDSHHAAFFRGSSHIAVDGRLIPVHVGSLSKAAGEPGLEVADFVMHAAQGQVRQTRQASNGDHRRDYGAVFIDVPEELVSYCEITSITADATYLRGGGIYSSELMP